MSARSGGVVIRRRKAAAKQRKTTAAAEIDHVRREEAQLTDRDSQNTLSDKSCPPLPLLQHCCVGAMCFLEDLPLCQILNSTPIPRTPRRSVSIYAEIRMTAYYVMILLLLPSALYAAPAPSAGGESAVEWRSFRGRVGAWPPGLAPAGRRGGKLLPGPADGPATCEVCE